MGSKVQPRRKGLRYGTGSVSTTWYGYKGGTLLPSGSGGVVGVTPSEGTGGASLSLTSDVNYSRSVRYRYMDVTTPTGRVSRVGFFQQGQRLQAPAVTYMPIAMGVSSNVVIETTAFITDAVVGTELQVLDVLNIFTVRFRSFGADPSEGTQVNSTYEWIGLVVLGAGRYGVVIDTATAATGRLSDSVIMRIYLGPGGMSSDLWVDTVLAREPVVFSGQFKGVFAGIQGVDAHGSQTAYEAGTFSSSGDVQTTAVESRSYPASGHFDSASGYIACGYPTGTDTGIITVVYTNPSLLGLLNTGVYLSTLMQAYAGQLTYAVTLPLPAYNEIVTPPTIQADGSLLLSFRVLNPGTAEVSPSVGYLSIVVSLNGVPITEGVNLPNLSVPVQAGTQLSSPAYNFPTNVPVVTYSGLALSPSGSVIVGSAVGSEYGPLALTATTTTSYASGVVTTTGVVSSAFSLASQTLAYAIDVRTDGAYVRNTFEISSPDSLIYVSGLVGTVVGSTPAAQLLSNIQRVARGFSDNEACYMTFTSASVSEYASTIAWGQSVVTFGVVANASDDINASVEPTRSALGMTVVLGGDPSYVVTVPWSSFVKTLIAGSADLWTFNEAYYLKVRITFVDASNNTLGSLDSAGMSFIYNPAYGSSTSMLSMS